MTVTITPAGPLAIKHGFHELRVTNYRQADALAHEEAARMTSGTRREADESQALAAISAVEFTFATKALRERFIKTFSDDVDGKSLGQVRQAKVAPKIEPHRPSIASAETAAAYAGLDATWHKAKYGSQSHEDAIDTGAIYAHAYTYASRPLVDEYVRAYARSVRAAG